MKPFNILITLILFTSLLSAQNWIEVGGGMNNQINKLVVYDDQLVASGSFTQAGGTNAYYIAFWNGSNWSGPDKSNIDWVSDIVVHNDTLFGCSSDGIYYWSDSVWVQYINYSQLQYGGKLIEYNNELYLYLGFPSDQILKIHGDSLIYIAGFGPEGGGVTDWCVYQGNLYIAGCYVTFTGVYSPHIAYYDGTTWYVMGSGLSGNSTGEAVTGFNNSIYIGGNISTLLGDPGNNLLEWDGSLLNSFPEEPNNGVTFLETINGKMYMGGDFNNIGNIQTTNLVVWDGTSWNNIGNINNTSNLNMVEYNGNLFIGGMFTTIDGDSINYIAYYDETGNINNEQTELDFNIYPNPTTGKIRLQAIEEINIIEIMDLQHKLIYSGKKNEIDLSQEPDGIYIIKVITDKQTITRKIIKH
ncbi:MAG: hypothetical protein Kow0068_13200 [Marinilabiliales bacterium]